MKKTMKNAIWLCLLMFCIACGKEEDKIEFVKVVSYSEEKGEPMDAWNYQGTPVEGMDVGFYQSVKVGGHFPLYKYESQLYDRTITNADGLGEILHRVNEYFKVLRRKPHLENSSYSNFHADLKNIVVFNYKTIEIEFISENDSVDPIEIYYSISPENTEAGGFVGRGGLITDNVLSLDMIPNVNFKIEYYRKSDNTDRKTAYFYSEDMDAETFLQFEI